MRCAHGATDGSSCSSHLQQFVEVFDVTFLRLLGGDLRLFEMDVLVVKCLMEDRGGVTGAQMSAGQTQS